jgi:hypothetical protein
MAHAVTCSEAPADTAPTRSSLERLWALGENVWAELTSPCILNKAAVDPGGRRSREKYEDYGGGGNCLHTLA